MVKSLGQIQTIINFIHAMSAINLIQLWIIQRIAVLDVVMIYVRNVLKKEKIRNSHKILYGKR